MWPPLERQRSLGHPRAWIERGLSSSNCLTLLSSVRAYALTYNERPFSGRAEILFLVSCPRIHALWSCVTGWAGVQACCCPLPTLDDPSALRLRLRSETSRVRPLNGTPQRRATLRIEEKTQEIRNFCCYLFFQSKALIHNFVVLIVWIKDGRNRNLFRFSFCSK